MYEQDYDMESPIIGSNHGSGKRRVKESISQAINRSAQKGYGIPVSGIKKGYGTAMEKFCSGLEHESNTNHSQGFEAP